MGEGIVAHGVSVGKPEGKRPLGRRRLRWSNVKMSLKEVRWGCTDWIDLAEDSDRYECRNESLGSIKCGEFLGLALELLPSQEGRCSMEQLVS
jgi:hypothetical protein